jgi:predicted O-methyltransferase YrrM
MEKFSLFCKVITAVEYIKYLWNAKGRHGTHSPFLYEFADKCLSIKKEKNSVQQFSARFQHLKSDNRTINIADFGAGSKYMSNERSIPQLLSTSSSKGKYGDLLYQIARYYKPKNILEFGTSIGIGTCNLSFGNPEATIVTVEACENTRLEALKNFQALQCENIESVLATFDQFLEEERNEKYDLVFIDGHHDGIALLNYMNKLESRTHNDTLFILDDIRWSESMFAAWNNIRESEDFSVTMDLFRMGIVLKRKQQRKEHFVVRI